MNPPPTGQPQPKPQPATVLLAHGSRDPTWQQPLLRVQQRMAELAPGHPVVLAFLEMSPPSLPQAVADLVAAGANPITVVPLFLGMGKHAREDLPQLAQQVRQAHPDLDLRVQSSVGEAPELIEVLAHLALGGTRP